MDPKPELDPDAYVDAEQEVSDLIAGRRPVTEEDVERLKAMVRAERTINAASGCPDCGVHAGCAEAVAERERLRAQNNERAGVLLHLASVLGDAPIRADRDMPEAVAEIVAERDRLRAVVDAALPVLRQVTDTLRDSDGGPLDAWAVADSTAALYRELAGAVDDRVQLDVSPEASDG